MMRLHWSSRSPFVRKVMVVAHERGLAERIERLPTVVALTQPDLALLPRNPLGKIPTLVLQDGATLYDSLVICEYLDGLGSGPSLFPPAGPARIEALRRHALGNGFMDMLLLCRTEMGREHPDRRILDGFSAKQAAVLEALEAEAPRLSGPELDIGRISIGCALSYLDFRWPKGGWRSLHPALAAWHEGFAARPSVQATEHVDA